jgi:hypothetical protein
MPMAFLVNDFLPLMVSGFAFHEIS